MTLAEIRAEIEAHSPYPLERIEERDGAIVAMLYAPPNQGESQVAVACIAISRKELDQAIYPLVLIYQRIQEAVRELSSLPKAKPVEAAADKTGETPC